MKTDVNLLPIYNKLYNLLLSEEELEKIIQKNKDLRNKNVNYNFISGKNYLTVLGEVNYYIKNDVIINTNLNEKSSFLKLIFENAPNYTVDSVNNCILKFDFLSIDEKDQKNIINSINIINRLNYEKEKNHIKIYKDVEEIKKYLKNIFTNTFFKEEFIYYTLKYHTNSINDFLCWVYDIKYDDKKIDATVSYKEELTFIYQFTNIYENNNIRIAIAEQTRRPYWNSTKDRFILIADTDQPCYNFLDKGRKFYYPSNKSIFDGRGRGDIKATKYPSLFFLNDEVELATKEEIYLEISEKNHDKKAYLVDNLLLETTIKRYQRKENIEKTKKDQENKLRTKIKEKLNEINQDSNKKINLNGITITKNSFEYSGQKLECEDINTRDLILKHTYYYDIDSLNFDKLSDLFFNEITRIFSSNNSYSSSYADLVFTGKIGDVNFKLENRTNTNIAGISTTLLYLNNFKIKKDEVGDILKRGLCFENQKAFNSFIHQVSKCSLYLHKYLNTGINLNVYDEYFNKYINFKIPLIRKNGKNFIIIDKKEYPVSDSNRLIKVEQVTQMYDAINVLLNPKIVKIDGPDDIAYIIKKGKELYQKDKDKNKKLIEKIETLFNISVDEVTYNGNILKGYLIHGKINNYFLDIGNTDKETIFDRLRVFSYPTMQYICMIDKGVQQTGPSHLINRIYALHNDSLVANEINTLKLTKN